MKHRFVAAAFAAACCAAVPVAAFEIVTDDSGLAAQRFFAEDPDGDDGAAPAGNQFVNHALGPYEYHVPEDAFPDGYSYSGYGFEDEALARHDDEQAKAEAASEAEESEPAREADKRR